MKTSISHGPGGRPLTHADALAAKPQPGIPTVLRFGAGLDLYVLPSGSKMWRCKVQRRGRETTLTLGAFPSLSLRDARVARMQARLAVDPMAARRASQAADVQSFAAAADQWMRTKTEWTAAVRRDCELRLAKHVFPRFGSRAIAEVTIDDVERLIFDLHAKLPAMAVAIKQTLCSVFDYAIAKRLIPFNPLRQILAFLPKQQAAKARHQPSVRTIEAARAVLHAFERQAPRMSPYMALTHRLIALTGVRKMEALGATWSEFDLDCFTWVIPAERMKGKGGSGRQHIVTLAPQAVDVVRAARALYRGTELVFPSSLNRKARADRSSLNDLMRNALKGTGLTFVPHGWRATFSTVMNELTREHRTIDFMLAHKPRGASDAEWHYNSAEHLAERRRLACQWADLLLEGAPSPMALIGGEESATNVVTLRRSA